MSSIDVKSNQNITEVMKKSKGLQRGLKERHVTMMTIGGTIGTGLFLGSGYVLKEAGPGGAVLAYLIGGLIMYFMMACLGELIVAMPVAGNTQAYASHFISRVMGFTAGWVRWLACAITITAQIVASSIIMKNVLPNVPAYIFIVVFTLLIFFLNILTIRSYGESEFWFAGIKVLTIAVFILTGLGLILTGGVKETIAAANAGSRGLFPNGFKAVLLTIMTASFAYGGTDLIASAAGESERPEENLPKAINNTVFGMLIIYIVSMIILGAVLPWQEADLKGSPFAYVFKNAGFRYAEIAVSMVVVTSALSSANSFLYSCTRTLWSLGKHEQAPKFLGKLNDKKIPVNALIVSLMFSLMALVSSFVAADTVYLFLISSIGAANMFLYALDCLCQYKFRKQYIKEGHDLQNLKYKTPLFPMIPLLGIVLYSALVIGMAFQPTQRIALYTGIPLYAIIYLGYKLYERMLKR
jgi:amino acid permease